MCPPCSQPLFWLPEGSTDEPPESSRGQREGCHSCLRSPAAQRPPRAPGNKPHPAYITKKGHFLSLKVCPAYSLLPPPGVSGFQGSVSEKFRTFNHTYPWTSRYVPGGYAYTTHSSDVTNVPSSSFSSTITPIAPIAQPILGDALS